MTDTIFKTFRAEVRGVNADEGTVDLMIPVSTASVDRDGEIVEPTAFKKTLPQFMKRAILVASHDYKKLTNQIGEWPKLKIVDAGFEGKPKYYINEGNEQADWGFKLASKGMAAFSIGFIPKEWEDGDGVKSPRRIYKEVELLEISQVIVPSNREAIQSIRSKGYGDDVVNKLLDDVLADKELVTKPEVTDEYIRIPVKECEITATIDISRDEGIKALYCGKEKEIATYLFAKDKDWTMEKARAWVKEHAKKYLIAETTITETDGISIVAVRIPDTPQIYEKKTSQEEIKDEIDYLKSLIEKGGISEDVKELAKPLIVVLGGCYVDTEGFRKRLSGSDIPADIKLSSEISYADIFEAIKKIAKKTEGK